jgi:DNA mismatch repair ATPase MutS
MNIQLYTQKITSWLIDKKTKINNDLIDGFSQSDADASLNTMICQEICKDIKCIGCDNVSDVGKDVYRDIEFFENINNNTFKTKTIFEVLNKHTLIGSEEVSRKIWASPINNINILRERQKFIQIAEAKFDYEADQKLLENMRKLEDDVLWLYKDHERNIEDLYNIVYFRFSILKPLNNFGNVLSGWNIYKILLSPLIGILSPIIYFVVPFLVLSYKFKIKMSFISYLKLMYTTMTAQDFLMGGLAKYKSVKIISYLFSMLFYFQGVFNSVEISRTLYKMSAHIVNKMNNVVNFLKSAEELINKYWNSVIIGNYVSKDNLTIMQSDEEKSYIKQLNIIDFSLFSNFGQQLKNYKFVDKDIISSVLSKVYVLDSIFSIIKVKKEYNLTYTNFIDSNASKPIIQIEGMWHPSISKNKAITNDIILGTSESYPNNAIITGTNAAGKSLLIKSILINTLLSQTCTLAFVSSYNLTPFHFINSQISIPDCTGHESLFQAEMHRCKINLDALSKLPSNKLSLIIIDEIFNSTNPVEAIAGGFAICKKLSNYPNSIMIFTTHFSYLTKLSKMTKKFKNYKMETIVSDEQQITFTYKLKKGINKSYIALELLRQEGFDLDIINDAIELKNKLSS